jgi:mono/diheme cytochrome c family protein
MQRARFAMLAVVCLVVAAISACGESDGKPAVANARGADVFKSQACSTCHGPDGAGTPFGPPLQGTKGFWTREKLVEYLKNPAAYTEKDPRLSAQAKRFTLPMQRFDRLPAEDLAAVADYVLAIP